MNGNLVDVKFNEGVMKEFLIENKDELEVVITEFIKKIYQFKNN